MEFCVKCLEHENEVAKLRQEKFVLEQKVAKLENEVDSLSLDLAFYNGMITNTGCDGK
jgi:uncharacterized protein YlxW (UPF0749 family)